MANSITLKVDGQTFSKANSRIFSYRSGRPLMFKNSKVLSYVESARLQLKTQLRNHTTFEGPIRMDITIWYQSRRSDLDVSLIQDILQEKVEEGFVTFKGAYKNDRQIEEIHAYRKLDKDNPRLEVTITELEDVSSGPAKPAGPRAADSSVF